MDNFLRVRIECNLEKVIARGRTVNLDGRRIWVPLRYEKLLHMCFICGLIVHQEQGCMEGGRRRGRGGRVESNLAHCCETLQFSIKRSDQVEQSMGMHLKEMMRDLTSYQAGKGDDFTVNIVLVDQINEEAIKRVVLKTSPDPVAEKVSYDPNMCAVTGSEVLDIVGKVNVVDVTMLELQQRGKWKR